MSSYVIPENLDHVVARDIESAAERDSFFAHARRLRMGDQWALYAERSAAARRALNAGDFAAAIVDIAIATEILFDALLGWALWESGESVASAAATLRRPLKERLKSEMHPRFGGTWTLSSTPELAGWESAVARPRNRVVHRGYRPTEAEAQVALRAATDLNAFVVDRILTNAARYPQLALAVLGTDGLTARGRFTRRLKRAAAENGEFGTDALDQYSTWRELVDARSI